MNQDVEEELDKYMNQEEWTEQKWEAITTWFHHRFIGEDKLNVMMAEQSILIASAARRNKHLSTDWEDYINEELQTITEEQIFDMFGDSRKYAEVNFTAWFNGNHSMTLSIDVTKANLQKLVQLHENLEAHGIVIDDDNSKCMKLLKRKDTGLIVDDNCKNRYSLSYQDLKTYWNQYDLTKAKGGICVKTEFNEIQNMMRCQCIFDYKHNNGMVKRYRKFKNKVKRDRKKCKNNNNNTNNNVISKNRNNWDCFHEKSFLLESHWFVHCGNACIWRDQYVFETSSYELKINGGEKYNVSINKIYNIDDIVLVIVDCISAAEGIIFQTDHLDQIEDKIQDLLKTMSYIQFRLKDMNKDNVDGIKLILSDAMIERNNTHCNYKGCLKSIMKLSKVLCRGCRSIYYCCKKCQKLDWKRHRYRCFRNRLSTERHSLKNKRYLFDWA